MRRRAWPNGSGAVDNDNDDDGETGLRRRGGDGSSCARPPVLQREGSAREEAVDCLKEAVSTMMKEYQRARREVLYGLDELGWPLEEERAGVSVDAGSGDRKWVFFAFVLFLFFVCLSLCADN